MLLLDILKNDVKELLKLFSDSNPVNRCAGYEDTNGQCLHTTNMVCRYPFCDLNKIYNDQEKNEK